MHVHLVAQRNKTFTIRYYSKNELDFSPVKKYFYQYQLENKETCCITQKLSRNEIVNRPSEQLFYLRSATKIQACTDL